MAHEGHAECKGIGLHIFVGVFQGVVDELRAFSDPTDAEQAFLNYCGTSWNDRGQDDTVLDSDLEGSTIYCVTIE